MIWFTEVNIILPFHSSVNKSMRGDEQETAPQCLTALFEGYFSGYSLLPVPLEVSFHSQITAESPSATQESQIIALLN